MKPEWKFIGNTRGNYAVPCHILASERNLKTIIVLPALGVRASFYRLFAEGLSTVGFNTVLFEQRGYGKSELRPGRHTNWGFKELVESDISAVHDWACHELGGDIALLGHSLGGHVALCYAALNQGKVERLILPGCGSPWRNAYSGVSKVKITVLYHLIPVLNSVFGYYRGGLVGFGGNEACGVMQDWRHLAKRNSYQVRGIDEDINELLTRFSGKTLSLRFSDDGLAPEAAVAAVIDKLPASNMTRRVLSGADLSIGGIHVKADHFAWARNPRSTVSSIADWW